MYCPFCGTEIPNESAFCGFCGKKIPTNEIAAVSEPAKNTQVHDIVDNSAPIVSESSVTESAEKAAGISESVTESAENTAVAPKPAENESVPRSVESTPVPEPVAGNPVSETVNNVQQEDSTKSGSVTYGQPTEVSRELSEGKEIKARRAFDITALLKNKLFLICAGAVLVFIILIIIAINSVIANSDNNPLKGSYYSVTADGETVFFYNGERIKGTDFSAGCIISAISEDGVNALVVDNSELTLLSKGKATKISDELTKDYVGLSANGKTAVYISDDELIAYIGGKENKICEVENALWTNFSVSPDGSTVVYWESGTEPLNSTCAWKGGKTIDLDAKFRPLYVSNGGKIIYGITDPGDFVYIKNLEPDSDEKIKNVIGVVDTTDDNSGILLSLSTGTYYFDASISEPIKVTSKSITLIDEGEYSLPRDNFKKFYAVSGTGVYRFTKKGSDFESEKIISGADRVKLSEDGKTFVYRDSDELVKVSASNPDKENVIAEDIYSFNCDPSLKNIYYLDEDGDLRYVSSKNTKICSDVVVYTVNFDGVCVFSDDDGDLYYSSKGGERKKVSGISEVEQITMINGIIYVRADGSLYVTTNGKKFEKTGIDF